METHINKAKVMSTYDYNKRRSTIGRIGDDLPQSHPSDDGDVHDDGRRMDDGEAYPSSSSSNANCCTWKVASIFLLLVASSLVVTWKVLPFDDIVANYIPEFDEPASPYTGPEAGGDATGGGGTTDQIPDGDDNGADDETIGTYVPSFMACPNDGSLCCNGSADNCVLPINEMMFGLVHNAMSSEGM